MKKDLLVCDAYVPNTSVVMEEDGEFQCAVCGHTLTAHNAVEPDFAAFEARLASTLLSDDNAGIYSPASAPCSYCGDSLDLGESYHVDCPKRVEGDLTLTCRSSASMPNLQWPSRKG